MNNRLFTKMTNKANKAVAIILTTVLFAFAFLGNNHVIKAKDSFLSGYIQTVYDHNAGLGSNEINCIYQSVSGYIWVGTDGGLYRYNGQSFVSFNLWDTEKEDIYNISCIAQSEDKKVWVGTENYGLFYIESGKSYQLSDEYYNGIVDITDIKITDEVVYVASDTGVYTCSADGEGNIHLYDLDNEVLKGKNIIGIETKGNELWAIDKNNLYIVRDGRIVSEKNCEDIGADEFRCITNIGGKIYIGSASNNVFVYGISGTPTTLTSTIDGINRIYSDSQGRIFLCADNGIGFYLNGEFTKIEDAEIDTYLTDIVEDYEGNLWISSGRLGVLYLAKSKFVDFNMKTGLPESMINCVYFDNNTKYIGSDNGLYIYDKENNPVENEYTELLQGVSVRDIIRDGNRNIWIATNRKYGLVKIDVEDGSTYTIARGKGLPSISINAIELLEDGRLAVATDDGLAIVNPNTCEVESTVTSEDGLKEPRIVSVAQYNKLIYLASDGGGLYSVNYFNNDVKNYTIDDGLSSNTITKLLVTDNGMFIGTDNGLCYYNESFRMVTNIDYSNSIYDIIKDGDNIWIVGSKGVICSTEEELLANENNVQRAYFYGDGLTKTPNTTSNSAIDMNGNLYVLCNDGICVIKTENISKNLTNPRIRIVSVDVDGEIYESEDILDTLDVDKDAQKVVINFAILSYSNRDNIEVTYQLKGFDEEPITINGNDTMQAVYTNLDGGTYEFTMSATNGDGVSSEEGVSLLIKKEKGFFEKNIARYGLFGLIVFLLLMSGLAVLRLKKKVGQKEKSILELSKEHEDIKKKSSAKNDYLANISNEIKTPISAIVTKADEMLKLLEKDSIYKDNIKGIYDAGNNILYKVDDIILLAKLEEGKIDVSSDGYLVTTLIYDLSEHAMSAIKNKKIQFFVEIGETVSDSLYGDISKIKEILTRIIDHSINDTKEGSITLSVDSFSEESDTITIVYTISDTGIGIKDEDLEGIFDAYAGDENNIKKDVRLNLSIVNKLSELLHGTFQVESVYGEGSVYTFAHKQKVTSNLANIQKIGENMSDQEAHELWLPDVEILLVEDDEISIEVEKKLLAEFDARVDVVKSSIDAIDMVMNKDYDVVLLDLTLPVMNGSETLKEIRELGDKKFDYLPIIAIDNDISAEKTEELLSLGFTDVLVKPFDIVKAAAIFKDCLPEKKLCVKQKDSIKSINSSIYKEGLEYLSKSLNVEETIERIGGNIDVFNKLVKSFYIQHESAADDVLERFEKDIRGFKATVHSLKTSGAYIGADEISKNSSRIEAAINIGNKHYVKEGLSDYIDKIKMTMEHISDYIRYVDAVDAGSITDQYIVSDSEDEKTEVEVETENKDIPLSIDVSILQDIKIMAEESNFDDIVPKYEVMLGGNYTDDDNEFLEVLGESVQKVDTEMIVDLINTYMDLKS